MQEQWIKELNKVFKFTIKVAKWLIKSEQAIIRQKIHRHCKTNKVELSRKMFENCLKILENCLKILEKFLKIKFSESRSEFSDLFQQINDDKNKM